MYYTLDDFSALISTNKYTLDKDVNSVIELLKNEVLSYVNLNEERPVKKYNDKNIDQRNRYKNVNNQNVKEDILDAKWDKQIFLKSIKKEEKVGIDKYVGTKYVYY